MNQIWKERGKRFWRNWLRPVLRVVIVLSTFRSAVADWNDVPTGSMKPTILEGDRIFVNKLAYDLKVPFTRYRLFEWAEPQRGDVVILFSPADGMRLVKRVIGVPGDLIELRDNRLYINHQPAQYARLDEETIQQIVEAERPFHRFAEESTGDRPHPVMTTPGAIARRSFPPVVVPNHCYFVMGDNRDESADSRAFGFVERDNIVGEATRVVLSLDPTEYYLPRWDRFFRELD